MLRLNKELCAVENITEIKMQQIRDNLYFVGTELQKFARRNKLKIINSISYQLITLAGYNDTAENSYILGRGATHVRATPSIMGFFHMVMPMSPKMLLLEANYIAEEIKNEKIREIISGIIKLLSIDAMYSANHSLRKELIDWQAEPQYFNFCSIV